jgi:hypothetical protein
MAELVQVVEKFLQPAGEIAGQGTYPGAVLLASVGDEVVADVAMGFALRYADRQGRELDKNQWIPMERDAIFDCKLGLLSRTHL